MIIKENNGDFIGFHIKNLKISVDVAQWLASKGNWCKKAIMDCYRNRI